METTYKKLQDLHWPGMVRDPNVVRLTGWQKKTTFQMDQDSSIEWKEYFNGPGSETKKKGWFEMEKNTERTWKGRGD